MDFVFLAWKEYYEFYSRERLRVREGKRRKDGREGGKDGGMEERRKGGRGERKWFDICARANSKFEVNVWSLTNNINLALFTSGKSSRKGRESKEECSMKKKNVGTWILLVKYFTCTLSRICQNSEANRGMH